MWADQKYEESSSFIQKPINVKLQWLYTTAGARASHQFIVAKYIPGPRLAERQLSGDVNEFWRMVAHGPNFILRRRENWWWSDQIRMSHFSTLQTWIDLFRQVSWKQYAVHNSRGNMIWLKLKGSWRWTQRKSLIVSNLIHI